MKNVKPRAFEVSAHPLLVNPTQSCSGDKVRNLVQFIFPKVTNVRT